MAARVISAALLLALPAACIPPEYDRRRPDPWREAQRQPLPPGNVRLTIDRIETDVTDRRAFEIALQYRDDSVTVQAGHLTGPNGLLVFAARNGLQAALRASHSRTRRRRLTRQFLVLMEGGEASFDVIQQRPVVWDVVIPLHLGAVVVRTLRERITGTGMRVAVRGVGPRGVDLEITPYLRRASDGRELRIEELKTRLLLEPGRPYVFMMEGRQGSDFAAGFLSFGSGTRRTQVIQVLTVETSR